MFGIGKFPPKIEWPFVDKKLYEATLLELGRYQLALQKEQAVVAQLRHDHDLVSSSLNATYQKLSTCRNDLDIARKRSTTYEQGRNTLADQKRKVDQALKLETEARQRGDTTIAELRSQLEDAHDRIDVLESMHATRVRIGSLSVDPIQLTARLHQIDPTLKAEYDGHNVVVYANHQMDDAQWNALKAMLAPTLNPT